VPNPQPGEPGRELAAHRQTLTARREHDGERVAREHDRDGSGNTRPVSERDTVLGHVRSLELRLLDTAVRREPMEVGRLLHPDFVEVGASGRVWDRESIIAALREDPGRAPRVTALAAHAVATDVVLVTYRAHDRATGAPATMRVSLWVRDEQGWRVRFHQGTPIAAEHQGAATA
jgi:hypothetical protein